MDETNDEIKEIRGRDLAGMGQRAPQKTWFFERMGDGKIFPCEEREAWDILYNRSEWKRHDFRIIGVSDGTTYDRMVKESMKTARELEPQVASLEREMNKFSTAREKLMVEEAVDMEDLSDPANAANVAKINRYDKIIADLTEKYNETHKRYSESIKDVVSRATEAELAVARANGVQYPSAMNIITPGITDQSARDEIIKLVPKK